VAAGDTTGTDGPDVPLLRPFLLTAGRVSPIDQTLEIEAQVATTELGAGSAARLSFEHRDILNLCLATISVAEVAANLGLHLGVAKILVADLAAMGYLIVTRPDPAAADDMDTIERVIRGLERIR